MPNIMESALQFIWFWPISCVNPILRGEPPPPISTPRGAYSGVQFYLILEELGNPVVGCESDSLHVAFNVHQSHRHGLHTPQPFLLSLVPLVYMWSAAKLGIVSNTHFESMLVGQSPIHVLTGLMIA